MKLSKQKNQNNKQTGMLVYSFRWELPTAQLVVWWIRISSHRIEVSSTGTKARDT